MKLCKNNNSHTCVVEIFDFGILKMAAARLAMGEGCHPLLLATTNLVVVALYIHVLCLVPHVMIDKGGREYLLSYSYISFFFYRSKMRSIQNDIWILKVTMKQ